ncbi:MFS transporter [Pontibacillus yanchengensis]|uniref:MFS transporter n=2 Tax=Pontibacillus yanchengensis TaxID=462910 RepID=A0ACC7VKC3_9BACI|nr:MFS transporter [Pontibacillus yanchengensis]MYL36127.1 MFS transporter [Pontibacillus yanchengensis]MYL55217.1 MFS transporter [Pontibacillus yanchengensis]
MNQPDSVGNPPVRTPFYYGWMVVFLAGLSVFFSGPGQTYSISIFIEHYIEDFEYSRSLVSGLYSTATLCAGFTLFLVGRIVDRVGQRLMLTVVGGLLALACFWNSFLVGPVMMFLGFFMLRLFGQGSLTLIPNTLVPQWFITKRGRALSVMAVGGFVSSALLPPLNTWLIDVFGWRNAWLFWGILLLLVFVPLVYFFVRNQPKDIGEVPDGNPKKKSSDEMDANPNVEINEKSWTLREAMKTRAFWLILFCVSVPALVNTGVTFHMVSIAEGKGLTKEVAALVLSLMAFVGFPVTFLVGYLVDRISVHYLLAITFVGHIFALLVLLQVGSWTGAVIYGVMWGLVNGFERIVLNIVWPNYFGREYLGSIKGLAQTVMVVGSAFGPLPFGLFYDWFGGYQQIIWIMMIFPLIAAIFSLLSPKPTYEAYHSA